jgi:histidyl-tRNA synthetase
LGGRETVPACGFSFGLERLALVTSQPPASQSRVLVAGVTAEDHAIALGVARELRGIEHVVVEQDVRLRGVKSALRYADRARMDLVVIVGERERDEGVVVLRDMQKRQESRVARDDLMGAVRSALS